MTNFNFLQQFFFLLVLSFTMSALQACSDDNDDNIVVEKPADNLPESSKQFIGLWRNNISQSWASDFLFWEDGTCRQITYSGHRNDGYWTYNEETGILATTTGGWQWQITIVTPESWSGISLGSNQRAMTLEKDLNTTNILNEILYYSTLTDGDSILNFSSSKRNAYDHNGYRKYDKYGKYEYYKGNYLGEGWECSGSLLPDKGSYTLITSKSDNSLTYKLYKAGETVEKTTYYWDRFEKMQTVKYSISYDKFVGSGSIELITYSKLKFSGIIEGTLFRKKNNVY